MIRGAVYRVDLGDAKRGHEPRGRRYGLVLSPSAMPWNVVTVIPTSTRAQPAIFRPAIELGDTLTFFLVDQIRTIDVKFVLGDPQFFLERLERDELAEIEHTVSQYLGITP